MLFNKSLSGMLCIILYNLLSGFNDVYLGNLVQRFNPFAVIFGSFLLVHLFFNLIEYKNIIKHLKKIFDKDVIILNVSTCVSWIASAWAVKFIEPAVIVAICLPMGPIITKFLTYRFSKENDDTTKDKNYILPLLIVVNSLIFAYITYKGKSAVGYVSTHNIMLSFVLIILTGISLAFQSVFSQNLSMKGWEPTQVLSVRFNLVLIVSFLLANKIDLSIILLSSNSINLVIFAIIGFIIPLYFYQLSIKKLPVIIVSLIIALGPCFTLLIEIFDERLNITLISSLCILLSVILTVINIKYEYNGKNIG